MRPEEMKALEAAATPGKWFTQDEWEEGALGIMSWAPDDGGETLHQITRHYVVDEYDARFIVRLRNLSPELIALWEACDVLVNPPPDCPGTDLAQLAVVKDCLNWLNAKAETI